MQLHWGALIMCLFIGELFRLMSSWAETEQGLALFAKT